MPTATLNRPIHHTRALPNGTTWTWLPRTSIGRVKRRTTWCDKLRLLDPSSPPEKTQVRLDHFARLFAFWRWKAISQQAGRHWYTLKHALSDGDIARHLLGNRLPDRSVTWVGTRAFTSTRYCLIDVDADDTPERYRLKHCNRAELTDEAWQEVLDDIKRELARKPQKPLYTVRCTQVEAALDAMGIDATNPDHVLIQPTPSGGRHYIFFLDASYPPPIVEALLKATGLTAIAGQIEFYPNVSRGIRLPFGWIPGQRFDPTAWIKFIDRYTAGRIKRFALPNLYEHLSATKRRGQVLPPSIVVPPVAATARTPTKSSAQAHARPGSPKRCQYAPSNAENSTELHHCAGEKYLNLIERGIRSKQDADELFKLGICIEGTRTTGLKSLAVHLIWFQHLPPEVAAERLTTWALNPRHASKDIRHDLERGTNVVAMDIARMCRWAADHKRAVSPTANAPATHKAAPAFAPQELKLLRSLIQQTPREDQTHQAHFYLRFLWFARRHGTSLPDGTGWEAAVAINAVVKEWEGCRHGCDYKKRVNRATEHGLLTMIKEKWQNPSGPGRARTYRLAVPVVLEFECVINYDAAIQILCDPAAVVPTLNAVEARPGDQHERPANPDAGGKADQAVHPPPLRPAHPREHLAQGPRKCPAEPDATPNVHHPHLGARRSVPDRGPRNQGDGVIHALTQPYKSAQFRDAEAAREQLVPKTWDGRPLPVPGNARGISDIIEAIKDELESQFPNQGARKHPTWSIVDAIARSTRHTSDERRLILSNPAQLSATNLEARKNLIRRHRKQLLQYTVLDDKNESRTSHDST